MKHTWVDWEASFVVGKVGGNPISEGYRFKVCTDCGEMKPVIRPKNVNTEHKRCPGCFVKEGEKHISGCWEIDHAV